MMALAFVLLLAAGWAAAQVVPLRERAMPRPEPAAMTLPAPPVARVAPVVLRDHGHERIDDYPWLREKNAPETLAHLQAENDYAAHRLAPLSPLIGDIARELRQRSDGTDSNLEFVDRDFVYERRIEAGAQFPAIVRRRHGGGTEEVVLDIERLSAGHEHYSLDGYTVSPDGNHVAFAVDFRGDLRSRIFVRDIAADTIRDTGIAPAGGMAFAHEAGALYLFYIRLQEPSLRGYQLWRHRVGGDAAQDDLVYEENDPGFDLRLRVSKSGRFVMLHSVQQQTTEIRFLPADRARAPMRLIEPRRQGHYYDADHAAGRFFIRTNLQAPDFRVVTAPVHSPDRENWQDFVPQTPGRMITRAEPFDRALVLTEEHEAQQSLRILRLGFNEEIAVPRPAEIGVMDISVWQHVTNRDPAATTLHVRFSGPLHPPAMYDIDVESGAIVQRWRSPAWEWFDPQAYEVRRIQATAPDGESVPATLIWRRDLRRPGGNPALISGYGAYGFSMLPRFHGQWISLVDRGFVYVLAHVRGGKEKGRRWHDAGRVLNKRNTFTDFIAVTQALAAQGYADPRRIFARGGSAGGMLMGALANMRPDLYAGLVAEVPFMDVISTTADPSLPTASLEYQEWGDPRVRAEFEYMLTYSPYENVRAQDYPPILATTARYDSQVGLHEPAKWVARLRVRKTDRNDVLLLTNMAAGHGGSPGRFGSVEESATIMAWMIALADGRAKPGE